MLLLVFAALGCQSWQPTRIATEDDTDALHHVLRTGRLRVGMSGVQPPLNMKNRAGELIGLDVDLARALAEAMEVELVLVERPFAALLDDLEAGELDMVISSMTITPARNARVAFAGPYLITGAALLVRSEASKELQHLDALNSPERRWAALAGSTHESLIEEAFPLAEFVPTNDLSAVTAAIRAGEIDGLLTDLPEARFLRARHPEARLLVQEPPLTTEPLGIALPEGSPLFANLVQNYLNTLDYTGLLIQMKVRWLSEGDWLSELP
jgi:ABC-type amino acid transport substrate-binding protein